MEDETISVHRSGHSDKRRFAQLHVVYPPELVTTVPLVAPRTILGRRPSGIATHQLDSKTVSRNHLELVWSSQDNSHQAIDLGSRNGSQVSGVEISAAKRSVEGAVLAGAARTLCHGEVLRLGDVFAVYEHVQAAPETVDDAPAVSRTAIPGAAAAIVAVRRVIARAAADPSPILLVGETGTGKELIARELHRLSGRSGPFVAVNCAAISPHLVESQLFGHIKGAFTGATTSADGWFRSAHGGTLFLDEIGELPLELQPKLLRAIQEAAVVPVGTTTAVSVDVRFVAATNRELQSAVGDGSFRRDLYARLAMWEVTVPPLRRRRSDLMMWLQLLYETWAQRRRVPAPRLLLDPDAAEAVLLDAWLENLRGLERLVHELAVINQGAPIARAQLPAWLGSERGEDTEAEGVPDPEPAGPPDRAELVAVLERHSGSVRATAKHYGRSRRQVYRWMDKLGIPRS